MSVSLFDTIANEPLGPSDQLASEGPSSSTEVGLHETNNNFLAGLVELCSQYASFRANNVDAQLTQTLHTAIGVPRLEAAILTLRGDVAAILLDLLQKIVDIDAFANPHHARRALRLLIKLAAASGSLPQSLYISNVFLEDTRNPTCLGGFSDVFRAKCGDECVALKRLRIYATGALKDSLVQRFNREALVWRQLKHPFILQFLGIDRVTFKEFPCMASYWMEHGSLKDYVQENRDQGRNRVRFLWEVAVALGYLHDFGIVHGDIRAANVFISGEEHVQLADFGLAGLGDTMTAAAATATSEGGSIRWTAPEFFSPTDYGLQASRRTRATDVYAYGGLCLEVLTGKIPFSHLSQDHPVLFKIASGAKPPAEWSLASSSGASSLLFSFIDCCWSPNATHRPTTAIIAEAFHAQLEGNTIRLEELNRTMLALSMSQPTSNRVLKRKPIKENNELHAQPPRSATDPAHHDEPLNFSQHYRQWQAESFGHADMLRPTYVQYANQLQPSIGVPSHSGTYHSWTDDDARKDIEHFDQSLYLNPSRQLHLCQSQQPQQLPPMEQYTSEIESDIYYNSLLLNPVDHAHSRYAPVTLPSAHMADINRPSNASHPPNTSGHAYAAPEGRHNESLSLFDPSSVDDPAILLGMAPRDDKPLLSDTVLATPRIQVREWCDTALYMPSIVGDPVGGPTPTSSGSMLAAPNNTHTPQPSLAEKRGLSRVQLSSLSSAKMPTHEQPAQHVVGDIWASPVQMSTHSSSNFGDDLRLYEQDVLSRRVPINLNPKLKRAHTGSPAISSSHYTDHTPSTSTPAQNALQMLHRYRPKATSAYRTYPYNSTVRGTATTSNDDSSGNSSPKRGYGYASVKRKASPTLHRS